MFDNYKEIAGGICAPAGFRANGVHCGIRKNKLKKDHTLYIDELMRETGLNTKWKSPNYQALKTRRNRLILHKTEGGIVNAK